MLHDTIHYVENVRGKPQYTSKVKYYPHISIKIGSSCGSLTFVLASYVAVCPAVGIVIPIAKVLKHITYICSTKPDLLFSR